MPGQLFIIGDVLLETPMGLNPQEVGEEFGADFAVKPIVGARQPREFVGPGDNRLTFFGTIFPYRYAAAGGSSGQIEILRLKSLCEQGTPLPIMRGDGYPFPDFWLIERGSIRHSKLSAGGAGRVQEFTMTLVRTPDGPDTGTAINLLHGLRGALAIIGA